MASAVLSMIGDKIGSFRESYQEKLNDGDNTSDGGRGGEVGQADSTASDSKSDPNGDGQIASPSSHSNHDAGNGASGFIHRIQEASHTAKVQSHIATLRACLTLYDREMKIIKEEFGLEAYEIMERNRNIGELSGGETDPEIVEIFLQCGREMKALYGVRKRKMTELTKNKKEKALCITTSTSTGTPAASSFETHEESPPAAPSSDGGDDSASIPSPSLLQRKLSETWNQAKESYKTLSQRSELKSDLTYIDKEITQRKQQFGVDIFKKDSKSSFK